MPNNNKKIVFFGTPQFAVESLQALINDGFNIAAVVTMPDKPAGRGQKLQQSPVKEFAVKLGLNVLQPTSLKDPEFINELKQINADLFIIIAFRMLPEVVWTMPPLGTFNLHASLLPRYRGAAPINRAIMNGDTQTGVTTFMLKHEIDTGDILQQVKIDILPDDNAGTIHDKLMTIGAALTVESAHNIFNGNITPIPQNLLADKIAPSPAPKIFPDDCKIDWKQTAEKIHNIVRGLSPYPAARSFLMSDDSDQPLLIKIFTTKIVDKHRKDLKPGSISVVDGKRLIVSSGSDNHDIEICELQPAGKKKMSSDAFLRGAHLKNPYFDNF